MSGRSIRRIAVFTPLPPTKSGIASYNSWFLPLLAERVGVTAFVDDRLFGATSAPPGVQVRPASAHDPVRFDLTVFHMGNHLGYHQHIYEALGRTPGLVVLHDMRMMEFFVGLAHDRPDLLDVQLPRSSAPVPTDEIDYAALEPLVRRARGVLVHSDAHARKLRRCFPGVPVMATRLALPPPLRADPEFSVESLGWPMDSLVVGAFGSIVEHRRLDRLLATIAGVRAVGHDVRVVIGGWVASAMALDDLESKIDELGLAEVARVFTDVSDVELHALHRLCDATFDLRTGLTGASSLSVATSLAHGLVTVTTSSPEFTEIVHPLLRHVSEDPMAMTTESAQLLVAMATDKAEGNIPLQDTAGRDFLPELQSTSVVAGHLEAIEACIQTDSVSDGLLTAATGHSMTEGIPPIAIVADISATTGLMEYGRSLIDLLHGSSVPLQLHERRQTGASHDPRRDIMGLSRTMPAGRDADVEIWFANINEFAQIGDAELRPAGTHRHIIASWFWELPAVLDPYRSQFSRVDEIWVGSPFVERTFRQYCDVPVTVIPMPVRAVPDERLERRDFDLPESDVLFYFDFDSNSHPARKNPLGLIRAFRDTFSPSDRDRTGRRPRLVLKGLHMENAVHRRTTDQLRAAMDEVGGVIIGDELDRRDLDALVNCCDVYVSLHRAEGLGIGMLEAMYMGKPVISPSYPDKWLFPAGEVGFAVPSLMRPIDESDTAQYPEAAGVYTEGLPWAEPDLTMATRHMHALFHEPQLRERVGARGARLVREHYNASAALAAMSDRLRAARRVVTGP